MEEFCYVSSFERLTSRKPKAPIQPAPIRMGVHLRNVLAITAVLSVGALVYALVGGGFPGLSAGVRSFLGNQAAKVRVILLGHDVANHPAAPAPTPPLSVTAASADQASIPRYTESSERLLYSAASIAVTPLK